jgi:hypothetical protein
MPLVKIVLFLFSLGLSLASAPALALVSWSFGSGCTAGSSGSSFGNSCSVTSEGIKNTATAWSTTTGTANVALDTAYLGVYSGGGLGVTNKDGTASTTCSGDLDCAEGTPTNTAPPEHAVDNNQRYDAVLFTFTQAVTLSQVALGYHPVDSDITVLAYAGTGAPTLAGQTFSALTSQSWKLVGNYADLNDSATVNYQGYASSYWIVAAYDPAFSTCTKATSNATSTACTDGNDYEKILSVAGTPRYASEPNTLLLLSLVGTIGWLGKRQIARG